MLVIFNENYKNANYAFSSVCKKNNRKNINGLEIQ